MAHFIYTQSQIDYVISCKVVVDCLSKRRESAFPWIQYSVCVLPVTSSYQTKRTVYSSAGMVSILYACKKGHMKLICIAYKHIVGSATFSNDNKNHYRSKSTKKP
jgi:hypothetical protein